MRLSVGFGVLALLTVAACSDPIGPSADWARDASTGAKASAPAAVADGIGAMAEPMMAPMIMEVSGPASSWPRAPRRGKVGVVTAADIDDSLNLGDYARFAIKSRKSTGLPHARLGNPVVAQLTSPDSKPAPGVRVTLRKPGAAAPFYDGYSGVDGRVTVFPSLHGASGKRFELRAFPENQAGAVKRTLSTGLKTQKMILPAVTTWQPEFLDLMFVVDTTGSMADELAFLTKEMTSIVKAAKAAAPGVDIRYGLTLYRDHGDDYVVRSFDFTKSASTMRRQLAAQNASGGGDYPEAAAQALQAAVNADWRRGKGERILFHVADAPPHDKDAGAYLAAAKAAAKSGIQIFGLGASGVAKESEYLMRTASVATNGRYLFLTDDSGVGNAHAEPTISCYQVTLLKSLLVRVLKSELSGNRVEPTASEVKRSVGTYRNGVCLN